MARKSRHRRNARPSWFVVAFGAFVGLIAMGYGAVMLFLRPVGIVACGRHCGLDQAMLALLGQPLYNLIFGLLWVAVGLAIVVVLVASRTRRSPGRSTQH